MVDQATYWQCIVTGLVNLRCVAKAGQISRPGWRGQEHGAAETGWWSCSHQMKQFSKKQSSHLSVVSPVSSSNCPRTLISTTPGYGSCSHQEHETRDILVTISNLEIYCREHRRWWCVSATRARLTIWRCVLEDNERDKTDAVPVCGDQHFCY